MALETSLNLTLQQKLTMTPRLQQSIQMLQMTVQELTALIDQEMLANPTLEQIESEGEASPAEQRGDEPPVEGVPEPVAPPAPGEAEPSGEAEKPAAEVDPADEFDWNEYFRDDGERGGDDEPAARSEREDFNYENVVSKGETLQDHLILQLRLAPIAFGDHKIGEFLIGNIDGSGYLKMSVEEIARFLQKDPARILEILRLVQTFDPLGVCARTPQECLLIQYRLHEDFEPGGLVERILEHHLDALSEKQFKPIAKTLGVRPQDVQAALDWISGNLDPRPGLKYSSDAANSYITPDVLVEKVGDKYVVTLNDAGLPRLRISPRYRTMARDRAGTAVETRRFIKSRLESAQWLLKSIQQRRETIFKVATAIVSFQRDFLDQGIAKFRPLTLREVAEEIGMHESTVSRVTTGKYMQTPRGVLEFKFFFSSGLSSTESGVSDVSSMAVKDKIRALIAAEDAKKPLSDQKLVDRLQKDGVEIARRTVAKYREELNIDPSSKRRRYD